MSRPLERPLICEKKNIFRLLAISAGKMCCKGAFSEGEILYKSMRKLVCLNAFCTHTLVRSFVEFLLQDSFFHPMSR